MEIWLDDRILNNYVSGSAKNPCSNCKQEIEKNFLKSSIKVDVILQADYACGGGDLALPVVLRTVNFSVASCPGSTIWSGADAETGGRTAAVVTT